MNAWQPKVSSPKRAQHLLSPRSTFFWRPGVRLPPPVSTKRELSGQSSPAAPQLCQQSAQERARCPKTNSSHSQHSFTGLCQKKLGRTPSAMRRVKFGSDGFDTRPDDEASPLLIQRTVTWLLFFSVQRSARTSRMRLNCERAQRWCLRAMRRHQRGVRIQSGLCADQTVSIHPRPRCQGQSNHPAPCTNLLMWAGRGRTRTMLPWLGRCSWSDPARSERDP